MERLLSVDDWKEIDWNSKPDGSWSTMMARVAAFHSKHDFANPENNGHDMGYRVALTVEELGEFAAAITKGNNADDILIVEIFSITNNFFLSFLFVSFRFYSG